MRIRPSSTIHGMWFLAMMGMSACGGSSGGGVDAAAPPDSEPGAPDGGADAMPSNACGDDGLRSESDSYLPADVGNTWRYRVEDASGDPPGMKQQEYSEMLTPDEETGPVILQVTMKPEGRTESWLQVQGDKIVRLQQQDFTAAGDLERTTRYVPGRLRIDQTPERLMKDATWVDAYVREVLDPTGTVTFMENVEEVWTVLDVDIPCPDPWAHLSCVHYERIRTVGGSSQKRYWFARGFGKIREEGAGGVIESLLGCDLQ